MGHVQVSRLIPASAGDVYRYITDLSNLPQWLDPSLEVEFPSNPPILRPMSEFELKFTRFGHEILARFRVDELKVREKFSYRQMSGFFKAWVHTQLLSVHDAKTTLLTDVVDFTLPYGVIGSLVDDLIGRSDVEKLLKHRLLKVEERFLGPA
jgi:ligand-binding SRPBCC domain-containing protein